MRSMAKTQKKTLQTKNTSVFYLGCCFGNSSKASGRKFADTVRPDGQKKKRWYSWFRFRIKKSGAKTVPVEPVLSEKANAKHKIPASKSKSDRASTKHKVPASASKSDDFASKPQVPVSNHKPPSGIPEGVPVGSDQAPKEKTEEAAHGPARNSTPEPTKNDTCGKRSSFCRKIEAIRAGSSQPGSPDTRPRPRPSRAAVISRAVSSPVLVDDKRVTNPSSTISAGSLKKPVQRKYESAKRLDPVVGLSILMITLTIMVFWGRVCAILCTSAWFYFLPRLRNVTKAHDLAEKSQNSHVQDLDSEKYKKKVVLEGLLERNHRKL